MSKLASDEIQPEELILVESPAGATEGQLHFCGRTYACALGRSGIVASKHEGDGATPTGRFPLRALRYRADRLAAPASKLSAHALRPDEGWCDAPDDPAYNRPVTRPYPASHEALWRDDHLYDVVIMLGYNDDPVIPGMGSAIFFHLAKHVNGALQPTEGCVALVLADMLEVLASVTENTRMEIRLKP